jgi:hypothetical protein
MIKAVNAVQRMDFHVLTLPHAFSNTFDALQTIRGSAPTFRLAEFAFAHPTVLEDTYEYRSIPRLVQAR